MSYCTARNQTSTAVFHAKKKKYERNIADNFEGNSKTILSFARNKTKAKTNVRDLKDSDGKLVSEDTEKVYALFLHLFSLREVLF